MKILDETVSAVAWNSNLSMVGRKKYFQRPCSEPPNVDSSVVASHNTAGSCSSFVTNDSFDSQTQSTVTVTQDDDAFELFNTCRERTV